jgi:hypothetical protein
MRLLFIKVAFCLRPPSERRRATAALAVRLVVPLAGATEDFHLQVSVPCPAGHTKKRQAGTFYRARLRIDNLRGRKVRGAAPTPGYIRLGGIG